MKISDYHSKMTHARGWIIVAAIAFMVFMSINSKLNAWVELADPALGVYMELERIMEERNRAADFWDGGNSRAYDGDGSHKEGDRYNGTDLGSGKD